MASDFLISAVLSSRSSVGATLPMLSLIILVLGAVTVTTVCGSAHTSRSYLILTVAYSFGDVLTTTISRVVLSVEPKSAESIDDTSNCGSPCGNPGMSACNALFTMSALSPMSSAS